MAYFSKPVSSLFACVDLFSGCGGNSWGMLEHARNRPLIPILALDSEPSAVFVYRRNMPMVDVLEADIRDVAPDDILRRIGLGSGELGCLIASPPCQTYSRNNRLPKDKNDYRNTLYLQTLRMIREIRPWVVFMENVPEMATTLEGAYHKDFLANLAVLGYVARHWTVDAADYGVPQRRERLIYLAYRTEMMKIPTCPAATHGAQAALTPWVTVENAIGDLPSRLAGKGPDWFIVDDAQKLKRSGYALSLCPSGSPVVVNHFARALDDVQIARLEALGEGQAYEDLPAHIKPKQGYKASYGRLWRSKPAPTLTTYLAYPGSGRFSHFEQNRVITIREALRLQSFDDSFEVPGILADQSTLVGNAVPPLLVAAFKKIIVRDLEQFIRGTKRKKKHPAGLVVEAQRRDVDS